MTRREFSKQVRRDAAVRAEGHCEGCGTKLLYGSFHYDHDIPDALGGEPTLENCKVLCKVCHSAKTTQSDVPTIAKSNRVRDAAWGIKRANNPMPGSKASGIRKRMNGDVVRRQPA